MGLLDQIRLDTLKFSSNLNEFAVVVEMIATTGEAIIIKGIHTKHHLGVDTDGNIVNSKKASVAIHENLLIAPYPCRNSNQEVDLVGHKVNVKDSSSVVKNYIVQSIFPDETLGLIILILEDFQ